MTNSRDRREPCDNCGFESTLVERRGYHICPLCVAWLEYDPSRHLKCERPKIIARIEAWQQNPYTHKLTCGDDSTHTPLQPVERGDRVVLVCPDCDYAQQHIPEIVLRS